MRYIRNIFNKLIEMFTIQFSFLEKKSLRTIDLSDLFNEDLESIPELEIMTDDFKSFSSTDDYNKEFLCVFQNFKRVFVLDHSHGDGHFRV